MPENGPSVNPVDDPRFTAGLDLIRRTGARGFQLRYSDDEDPVVWIAVGQWRWGKMRDASGRVVGKGPVPVGDGPVPRGGQIRYECAAALDPLRAVLRLLDQIIDGGHCAHCSRPTGVSDDWTETMPLDEHICWYQFDPELSTFRRACEGE